MIEDEWVDLADAVRVVREQLEIAREAGESEQTRFTVDSVEIELAVQVTKDVKAKGGVRLGVVSFEAGGGGSSESVHRVKLSLSPGRDGRSLEIDRERAELPPGRGGSVSGQR
jgi:hypothetical protein